MTPNRERIIERLPIGSMICRHCWSHLQSFIHDDDYPEVVNVGCEGCGRRWKLPTVEAELVFVPEGQSGP